MTTPTKHFLTTLGVFAVIICIVAVGRELLRPAPPTTDVVACTAEARQCPDGSFVGRTGLQCEFAVCPPVVLAIGETQVFKDVRVTPRRVVEDSRCPADPAVQCVWEGRLLVEVEFIEGGQVKTRELPIGAVFSTSFGDIRLNTVTPAARVAPIDPTEYRFAFVEARLAE